MEDPPTYIPLALFVKEAFRGRGMRTEALCELESHFSESMAAIELGIHESKCRAKKLHERLGYKTVESLEELGFEEIRKRLSRGNQANKP